MIKPPVFIVYRHRVKHLTCKLLCCHRSAFSWRPSPEPGWLKILCIWQRKMSEITQLDTTEARPEAWSPKRKVAHMWATFWKTLLWEDAASTWHWFPSAPLKSVGSQPLQERSFTLKKCFNIFDWWICTLYMWSHMWLCRNRSSFLSLAMCCAAFSTQKHTPPITHIDKPSVWLDCSSTAGVALLKTTGYSDLYQVQLLPRMINMFKTVPHWGENRAGALVRKSGVPFSFNTDIFQTCLLCSAWTFQ